MYGALTVEERSADSLQLQRIASSARPHLRICIIRLIFNENKTNQGLFDLKNRLQYSFSV